MRELWLVGIGTGNPDHLTLEGRRALREAALVLVPRKGSGKDDLADLRHAILESAGASAPVVEFDMPVRDETLPYMDRVYRWHDEIAHRWSDTIARSDVEGPVALLVWGDPGLYDSTLRIAERLRPAPRIRVVPGISALQALTAAHAIPFNMVNGAVTVTTGGASGTTAGPKTRKAWQSCSTANAASARCAQRAGRSGGAHSSAWRSRCWISAPSTRPGRGSWKPAPPHGRDMAGSWIPISCVGKSVDERRQSLSASPPPAN